jgi:hypothetical protein
MSTTMSLVKIDAHEQTICDIFSDKYEFEIPPYQRPYAWEQQHASALLSDIVEAMDNSDASGGIYFLGSIVLIKSPSHPNAKVIDGQQRLTTLTILLAVLRDLTSKPETRQKRGEYIFQEADQDKGTTAQYRLKLRDTDRPFFTKVIQKPDSTMNLPEPNTLAGSQQRISENALHFRKRLAEFDESRRNQLFAFIIQRCYLVVVAVPTPQAARRIFTVLNARGMDLTPTDILKANLLERAGEQLIDLAKRWEAVEDALGRESFVELFGHIRMLYERDKPRIALEDGFPKFVEPFNADCESFVSNLLEPLGDAYQLLNNSPGIHEQFGLEAAKAVRSLQRIDNKDWIPPALLRLWNRKENDAAEVANFLIQLERLAYFLFVTRADVNTRIARFSAVMEEFQPLKEGTEPSPGLALSQLELGEFVKVLDGPIYTLTKVCRPVLQRLDESLAAGGATYDTLVSIEHVLPQTVEKDSEWEQLFPDEPERSEWTHRLGNLVLLTHRINSAASNWDFKKKKEKYFQSKNGATTFPLTLRVLQVNAWTLEKLKLNQKELVTKLQDLWHLSVVSTEPATELHPALQEFST